MRSLQGAMAVLIVAAVWVAGGAHAEEATSAEEVVAFVGFGLETGRPDWFPSRTPGVMVQTSKVPLVLELVAQDDPPAKVGEPAEHLVAKIEKLGDCAYRLSFDAYLEHRALTLVLTTDFSKASTAIRKSADDGFPRVAIPGLVSQCQSSTGDCGLLAGNELGLNGASQDRLTKGLAYFQAHFCTGASAPKKALPF